MATTEELQTKLDEYKAAEADQVAKRTQYDDDADAEQAAVLKTTESRTAWIEALTLQHQLDDEFDALSAGHEPPALPDQPPE
jgi:nitric oxide reductase activation protein